jgi:hypothetical protein
MSCLWWHFDLRTAEPRHPRPLVERPSRRARWERLTRVLGSRGLEQLDRVPGWVLDDDLLPSHAGDDLVAEANPRRAQRLHGPLEVRELEGGPLSAARTGWRAIRHRLPAATTSTRCAQCQTEVAAEQQGERGCRVHLFVEPEVPAVEVDGRVDIIDDVTDCHRGHNRLPARRIARVALLHTLVHRAGRPGSNFATIRPSTGRSRVALMGGQSLLAGDGRVRMWRVAPRTPS